MAVSIKTFYGWLQRGYIYLHALMYNVHNPKN